MAVLYTWSVTGDRPAGPQDRAYEESDPHLAEPNDPNNVPGPGSLSAVVKIDSAHHPHIYIEDNAAHTNRYLIDGSMPRWSPDSRSLAVAAVWGVRDVNTLFWVHIPSFKVTVLDTLPVFADYEDLSWSPDSRALVTTRITANDHVGVVFASDIWLFSADGQRCQLTETKELVESEPKWIDAGRILYSRQPPNENGTGDSERRVISLARAARK